MGATAWAGHSAIFLPHQFLVWSLNGSEIGRTVGSHFLDWRAQAGEYRLRADAAGSYDEVRFTVE